MILGAVTRWPSVAGEAQVARRRHRSREPNNNSALLPVVKSIQQAKARRGSASQEALFVCGRRFQTRMMNLGVAVGEKAGRNVSADHPSACSGVSQGAPPRSTTITCAKAS